MPKTIQGDCINTKIREYKCKRCAQNVQVPYGEWKALPQKWKRVCPTCYKNHLSAIEDAKERRQSFLPYGPFGF